MTRSAALFLLALPALTACGSRDAGTSIAINSTDGSGTMNGASGEVKIDTPVFQGTFKLPKLSLTADDFDIDGVKLYPGSKINAMNVENRAGGKDGQVTVRFESPANVDAVRDRLAKEFEAAGKPVAVDGNALRGTTSNKPFHIELSPSGTRTTGMVTIG